MPISRGREPLTAIVSTQIPGSYLIVLARLVLDAAATIASTGPLSDDCCLIAVVPQALMDLPGGSGSENACSAKITPPFRAQSNRQVARTSTSVLGLARGGQPEAFFGCFMGFHLRHIYFPRTCVPLEEPINVALRIKAHKAF